MVFHFHRGLSESKSPQVFRTLLSILADLSNMVCMVSVLLPISPISFLSHWELFLAHQRLLVSMSPSCYTAFSVLWQDPNICLAFLFIQWSAGAAKFTRWQDLFEDYIWPSGRDWVICLYLKVQKNFMRLIFLDRFWFVLMPFRSMVKS